jgi:ribosomal protein S27E
MIERIFYGRNGIDGLSLFCLFLALIFMQSRWTWILALALIIYALFRCFSKNISQRRAEQWKFQIAMMAFARFFVNNTAGIRKFFRFQSLKWKNRKTTVYFKCPNCKNVLSLPKHKGKLAVTCTVCGHEFIKKT